MTFQDLFHGFTKFFHDLILTIEIIQEYLDFPLIVSYFARKELWLDCLFYAINIINFPSTAHAPTCMIFAGSTFRRVQLSQWTKLYRSPGTLLAKFCSALVWSRSYWSMIGCQPNWTPSFWKDLVPLALELYRAAMLFLSCKRKKLVKNCKLITKLVTEASFCMFTFKLKDIDSETNFKWN